MVSVSHARRALTEEANRNPGVEWIFIKEAATRLCVHHQTIRDWIREGRIDARRFGPKLIRIDAASLDAMGEPITWVIERRP